MKAGAFVAKIGSGTIVTGLTVAALAAVAALAVQAKGTEQHSRQAAPNPSVSAAGPAGKPAPPPKTPALPGDSGSGRRVVYSLGKDRVWLVDPAHTPQVVRSFTVQPSTVDPAVGSYTVYGRTPAGRGSDGRQIEHVVRFARASGVVIGFSAAVDGTTPAPDPGQRTGGIRETRADGLALWEFAATAPTVVVVP